jgi:hypothetical protein
MGVVLPHGGFVSQVDEKDKVEWQGTALELHPAVVELKADFAAPNEQLGFFRHGAAKLPLLFLGEHIGNDWYLQIDDGRWVGFPEYFVTEETAEALKRGKRVWPNVGKLDVDGVLYRLHAACFEGVHVALLIKADT